MTPCGQFSAELESQTEVNYLVNLNSDKVYNIHLLHDEKLCLMRNCNEDGNLLDLRQLEVTFASTKPWCLLHIKTSKIEGINVDIPVFSPCSLEMLTLSKPGDLFKSLHSYKMCQLHYQRSSTDGWVAFSS